MYAGITQLRQTWDSFPVDPRMATAPRVLLQLKMYDAEALDGAGKSLK